MTSRSSRIAIVFLIVLTAIASSTLNFGQRENRHLPESDSDYYLDMAQVFLGEKPAFEERFVTSYPHHYNRPALPFLAGLLSRAAPGASLQTCFSLLNVLAAICLGWMLYLVIRRSDPELRYAWAGPFLLLTGFPQLNWGYHVLTDTLGLTTALGSALVAVRILEDGHRWPRRWFVPALTGLFLLQALAFLARETAWLSVVVVALYGFHRLSRRAVGLPAFALVLLVVIAAKLPGSVYAHHYGVHAIDSFHFSPRVLLSPWYVLDFLAKSAVAFHLCWIPVVYYAARRDLSRMPPFVLAWSVAALLYMGAGYAHNSPSGIGYPLRLTYSLFPLVFLSVVRFFNERPLFRTSRHWVYAVCTACVATSVAGVLLDDQRGRLTIEDLASRLPW